MTMKIDGTKDRREPIRVVELRGELMTDSITPTQEIEMWIRQHGSERDALNVAIARIRQGEAEKERLVSALTEIDSYNRIHNDLEAYLSELADWGLSRRETRPTADEFGFKTS